MSDRVKRTPAVEPQPRQQQKLNRSRSGLMRLEPRVMLDAAAAVDALTAVTDEPVVIIAPPAEEEAEASASPELPSTPAPDPASASEPPDDTSRQDTAEAEPEQTETTVDTPAAPETEQAQTEQAQFEAAEAEAKAAILDHLAASGDTDALFESFSGNDNAADADWLARADALLDALQNDRHSVANTFVDADVMPGKRAAFAAAGTEQQPTIYLNSDWWVDANAGSRVQVVTEEIGHSFDWWLNPDNDTAGDEGALFAARVLGLELTEDEEARLRTSDDHGRLSIDGRPVAVEFSEPPDSPTSLSDANSAFLRLTAEDTERPIQGISLSDADDPEAVTVRIETTDGTARIATLGTATISAGANASADLTLSGSLAAVNDALSSLQFLPALNRNSSTTGFSPGMLLTATDVSNNGTPVTLTIGGLEVTQVNDAPDLSTGVALAVAEGGSAALGRVQLASSDNALDPDIETGQQVIQQQVMQIKSLPGQGSLSYDGSVVIVDTVIPVIDLGQLVYNHNGNDLAAVTTDSFDVVVSDGGGGATAGSITINLSPVNKAPTVSGAPTLIEGQVKVVAPTIDLGDSFDTLANATILIDTIVTGNQGTFFIDANNNNVVDDGEELTGSVTLTETQRNNLTTGLKFLQDGAEPDAEGQVSPSYRISVTDAGGGTGTAAGPVVATINLTVDPNNDDPVLNNAHASEDVALTVDERTTTVLDNSMLQITDGDLNTQNDQLVYTLGDRPTKGELQLQVNGSWRILGTGARFTQADIDNSLVRYRQTSDVTDNSDNKDLFRFTVRDSAFGYDVWTDPANPVGGREGGVRDTPTGPIATQSFHISINPIDHTPGTEPGAPTPGFGNLAYTFVASNGMLSSNSVANGTWNEDNAGATDGAYVIIPEMLSYTIRRTDTVTYETVVVPARETVYTLTTQPDHGTVQRQIDGVWRTLPSYTQFTQADINEGRLRFVHDGSEDHIASFGYRVSDGTPNFYDDVFTVDVTPINDQPTASGGTALVREGETVRLTSAVLGMADVDGSEEAKYNNPAEGITQDGVADFLWFQITGLPKDGGNIQRGELQRWDGSAWITVSTAHPNLWFPSSLLSETVDGGTSGLRYVHDGSEPLTYTGGSSLTFTYRARDDLAENASTATSVASLSYANSASTVATATINIAAVNDAPQIADKPGDVDPTISATITDGGATTAVNAPLTGVVEGSQATITSAHLTAIDPDNTTTQRQYRLMSLPSLGTIRLDGKMLGLGSTFSQADIDLGKVSYRHGGSEVGALTTNTLGTYNDKFHFIVDDSISPDIGSGAPDYNTYLITLAPSNDPPVVSGPSGPVLIGSSVAANNPVSGISISDPDVADGLVTGETDFVQATVRLRESGGDPITNLATGLGGAGVKFGYTAPATPGSSWAVTSDGIDKILQVQGSLSEVNVALAGLTVTFDQDLNTLYDLEVIVDDRLRDENGDLTSAANGGGTNQANPPAIPETVYDWSSTASVPLNDANIDAITISLRASSVNEAATLTGPTTLTVNEDTTTLIDGDFVVDDPESTAFGTPVSVTLSVGSDQGTLAVAKANDAGTAFTPSGGQAVTISGQNSGSLTLTGRAADIQALLNQRNTANDANDPNGGVTYTPASNANHDVNGAADGDITLTLSFDDSGSRFGGDVGDGSQANSPSDSTLAITLTAVNDAPVVNTASTDQIVIANTAMTAVGGFSISDVDSNDGYATGETDFVQALVRILDENDAPLAASAYAAGGAGLNIGIGTTASATGATVDATLNGSGSALEVRGTLSQVNAWLAGLQIRFEDLANADVDAGYAVEVVVDDRLRDGNGNLTSAANGGGTNQEEGLPSVPTTDTFDPYATAVSDYSVYNVTSADRALFVSTINDPGSINASDVNVDEGNATLVLDASKGNITISDPDDNAASNLTAKVTVSTGTITNVGGSGGTVTGTNSSEITITGTEAQLNARLKALTISYPDPTGDATAADWNGSFTVTVVYSDAGNTGTRPGSLAGDSNDGTANPGNYDYADDSSNVLTTTRVFTVTVNPVNDAPTRIGDGAITLTAVDEDTTPSGNTVANLFGSSFSDALDTVDGGSSANTFAGVAITGNSASADQGSWEYSSDGSNWTALPGVNTSSALLLKDTDRLRFLPAADFHGTPGSLDLRLIDSDGGAVTTGGTADLSGANSGGSTVYSDSSNALTLSTTVTNVNDRPSASNTTLAAVEEDATDPSGAKLSTINFGYSDGVDDRTSITGGGDAATAMGGLAVVGNAADSSTQGEWQYSNDDGSNWTPIGSGGSAPSDNAALILSMDASIRFFPNVLNYNGTPGSLTIRVADSSQTVTSSSNISASLSQTDTWSETVTLGTTVSPQNDAPTVDATISNPTVTEKDTTGGNDPSIDPVNLVSAVNSVSDIDLTTTAGLDNNIFGDGTITVSLSNGVSGDQLIIDPAVALPTGVTTSGGTGSTPLTINLASGTTLTEVDTLLESIQYRHVGDDPTLGDTNTIRNYSITLNDGINQQSGGNAGGSALSATALTGTITLTATNDPGSISANTVTVDEGSATLVLDASNANITISDPDDGGANNLTATVTVSTGTITNVGGSGGTVTGTNSNSVTITGTEAQLNARLKALTISYPDPTDNATASDWNGSFTVTVVYSDAGNTGTRPGALAGDSNNKTANPGDYNYVDGSSNVLTTTREFTVTVNPVNDAPTRIGDGAITLNAVAEDTTPSGDTVANLFGGSFSDALDTVDGGSSANTLAGVAITGNSAIAGQGSWQYSSDGSTWTALPGVSTSNALLLKDSDHLRFLPAADFHGTPGSLNLRLVDSSGGAFNTGNTENLDTTGTGGTTRYSDSDNALTLGTTVTTVNDAPVASGSATLAAIDEGNTNPPGDTISALFGNNYTDSADDQSSVEGGGNDATQLQGVIVTGYTAKTVNGAWQTSTDNGTTWTAIPTNPSDAQGHAIAADARIRFLPATTTENGPAPELTVRLVDGSGGALITGESVNASSNGATTRYSSGTVVLQHLVTSINDPPGIGNLDATAVNATVETPYLQGGAAFVIDPDVAVSDQELGAELDNWQGATVTLQRKTTASADDVFGASGNLGSLDAASGDIVLSSTTIGSYTRTGGVLTLTFGDGASTTQVNETLRSLTYRNAVTTPGALTDNEVTLELSINDQNNNVTGGGTAGTGANQGTGGALSATDEIIIHINRLPIANADTVTIVEDTASVTGDVTPDSTSGGDVADTDQDAGQTLVVDRIKLASAEDPAPNVAAGSTRDSNPTSITGSYGTLALGADGTYRYTLDNGNAAVQALAVFETLTEVFTYSINDGKAGTSSASLTVTIQGSNDAPSITHTAADPSVTENTTTGGAVSVDAVDLLSPGDVSDVDADTVFGAGTITVTLTDGIAGDQLIIDPTHTLPTGVTTSGGTGSTPLTISLAYDTTLTQVDTLLESIQYQHVGDDPTVGDTDTSRSYTVELDDGANLQSGTDTDTAALSAPVINGTITLTATNDPGSINASDVNVDEGSATLVVDASNANITISDPDDNGANDLTATVTVSTGTITAVGGSGGTVSDTLNTGTVTLTGTEAELNARLKALTISYPDPVGGATAADWNGSFTVTVVYSDAGNTGTRPGDLSGDSNDKTANPGDYNYVDGSSNVLTTTRVFTVTVNPVNDAPTRTGGEAVTLNTVSEDASNPSGATVTSLFNGRFQDTLDAVTNGSSANTLAGVAITGNSAIAGQGSWQYSSDGSTWTALPGVSTSNALLLKATDHLRFLPTADFHGTPGSLDLRLVDSSGSAFNTGDTENLDTTGTGGTTRYSDSSNALTLSTAVDPVNDAPVASGSASLAAIGENTPKESIPGATISALFAGNYDDSVDDQSSVTGGVDKETALQGVIVTGHTKDAAKGLWQVSSDNGGNWSDLPTGLSDDSGYAIAAADQLRFVPATNYNGPAPELTVRLVDGSGAALVTGEGTGNRVDASGNGTTTRYSADPVILRHLITAANDAPTITNLDSTGPGYLQGSDPIVIDADVTLADAELGTELDNWQGATVTLQRKTTASTDDVFGASGNLGSLDAASGDIVLSGTTIGNYTRAGGVLTLTFGDGASTAKVNETLQSLTYRNAVTTPGQPNYGSVTLALTVNDQNSNATGSGTAGTGVDQGTGGARSATADVVINIARQPVANADTATVDEGVATTDVSRVTGNVIPASTSGGNVADTDPDGDTLTVTRIKLTFPGDTNWTVRPGSTSSSDFTPVTGAYGFLRIGADGSYQYTVDNTSLAVQALSDGESRNEVYTYTISDGNGGTASTTLTITIQGTTDAPTITTGIDDLNFTESSDASSQSLSANGSFVVDDVETSDRLTVASALTTAASWSGGALDNSLKTALEGGWSLAGTNLDTPATLPWTYSVPNLDLDFLARDETITLTFTATTTDTQNASVDETVTITITGSNETPVINATSVAAALTENAGAVADNPNTATVETGQYLLGSGSIGFSDEDRTDTATVTAAFVSATPGNSASVSAALDTALRNLSETFVISGDGVAAAANSGSTSWSFALDDTLVDSLAEGEVVTVVYRLTVTDDSGVTEASGENQINRRTQDVTITLTGVNDTPVLGNGIADLDFTEAVDASAQTLSASGTLAFDDIDASDTITISSTLSSPAVRSGGPLDPALKTALEGGLSVSGNGLDAPGSVAWSYTVPDLDLDFLVEGETIVLGYTVTITDPEGATDSDSFTITLTGTNDLPVLTAVAPGRVADAVNSPDPGDSANLTGTFVVSDVDSGTQLQLGIRGGSTAGAVTLDGIPYNVRADAPLGTLYLNDDDGRYRFVPDVAAVHALPQGNNPTASFVLTVSDDYGTLETPYVVQITGANDSATITGPRTGAVTEGDPSANSVRGTLTVTDPDTGESVFAPAGRLNGTYGQFQFNTTSGAWVYVLDNTRAATLALGAGQRVTDTLTVTSLDGTASETISIDITGVDSNDRLILAVPEPAVLPPSPVSPPAAATTPVAASIVSATAPLAPSNNGLPAGNAAGPGEVFGGFEQEDLLPDNTRVPARVGIEFVIAPEMSPSGEHELKVFRTIPDVFVSNPDEVLEFTIPSDAFIHTDETARVEVFSTRIDGSELPEWLVLDPNTGTFVGTPPDGSEGELLLRVVARDQAGREAETLLRLVFGEEAQVQDELRGEETGDEPPPEDSAEAEDAPPAPEPVAAASTAVGRASLSAMLLTAGTAVWKQDRATLLRQAGAVWSSRHKTADARRSH